MKVKEYTAIYSTEALKGIHYAFKASSVEDAVKFCHWKFDDVVFQKGNFEIVDDETGQVVWAM